MHAPKLEKEFDDVNKSGTEIAKEMISILEPFVAKEFQFDEETWNYTFLLLSRVIKRWWNTNKIYYIFSEFKVFFEKTNINTSNDYPKLSVEKLLQELMFKIEHRANKCCYKKTNTRVRRNDAFFDVEQHILNKLRNNCPIYFEYFFLSGKYKSANFTPEALKIIEQYLHKLQI